MSDRAAFLVALAAYVLFALWLAAAITDPRPLACCPKCQLEGAP